jgi:glucokinase
MAVHSKKSMVLAGDIGGTKTNLGLFSKGKNRPRLELTETYSSRDEPNLETIIARFIETHDRPVTGACFGIAGPVVSGRSKTTNLPWVISGDRIKKRFKWSQVRLINDLTATALAIPLLRGGELYPLNRNRKRRAENLALIAPGTGLGQALLIFQKGRYIPIPSEGGHADFSPRNDEEIDLWKYLHGRFGHVSIERVLSGSGLNNIYSWLKVSGRYKEPPLPAKMIRGIDPAKAITQSALAHRSAISRKALNHFVSILGAVSGNLALTGMATGGVCLGGGIPPKILPAIKEGLFMKAFTDKGRFKGLLEKIPVRVILNDKAALLGAAHCAMNIGRR